MKTQQIIPTVVIVLNVAASIVYFCKGDWRHGLYWASAATLTFALTF